ncbi:hypothetical protein L3X38_009794 [Prunus dulcis]|uniref:Uncharacterized protein n=1 Tax=Prunus dulcis TaxID=3755 RepID=A0AAD4ZDL8_PRUDU|nr:hypothetical protein L3X38_009794 [Prunus dulcis]
MSSNTRGEIPISIRQQRLVHDLEALPSSTYHKGIIDHNACDGLYPIGLKLCGLLHEFGDVFLVACESEGIGDDEEEDLLGLGELGDGDGLDIDDSIEVGEGGVRKLVANSNGDGDGRLVEVEKRRTDFGWG